MRDRVTEPTADDWAAWRKVNAWHDQCRRDAYATECAHLGHQGPLEVSSKGTVCEHCDQTVQPDHDGQIRIYAPETVPPDTSVRMRTEPDASEIEQFKAAFNQARETALPQPRELGS